MSQRRSPSTVRSGRRFMACYHEAGHCLARWWFGHSFDRVLVLTAEEVARKVQPLNRRGVPTPDIEGFMDCFDLVSYACTPDLLDNIKGEPDLVARFRRNTRVLVEMSLVENFIGAAAEARYRKCSFIGAMLAGGGEDLAQARQTLDTWFADPEAWNAAAAQAEQRAMALVRSESGWLAVIALANALMDRGELQWDEAEPLLSAAYGCDMPNANAWMASWPPSLDMIRDGQFPAQEIASYTTHRQGSRMA